MSSSTSSSDRARRRVAICLCLFFAALEAVTRLWLIPGSKDLRRMADFPARARALVASAPTTVAVLGDSTADLGVDPRLLASALEEATGREIEAGMFPADGATASVIRAVAEAEFFKPGLRPTLIVIGYHEDALDDGTRFDVGRSARFLVEPGDWPEVFRLDVPGLEQRADLVTSSFWATFAARDRIQERVLASIPGYKTWVGNINGANFDELRAESPGHRETRHEVLRRFVERARDRGVRLCFVAFPILDRAGGRPRIYDLPAEVPEIVREGGMLFIDLRFVEGLQPRHYRDHLHLNELGRPILTRRLARDLAAIWRPDR